MTQMYQKWLYQHLSKVENEVHIFFIISSFRLHSPQMDSAEAQQHRRLRDRIALLSAHRPFQHLDIIATLGMGGFGRVELVSLYFHSEV